MCVIARTTFQHGANELDVLVPSCLLVVVLAERSITNNDELRLAALSLHLPEGVDQRGQAVARIEASEEENCRNSLRKTDRYRRVGMKDVGVDAVGNDLPVRLEVTIEGDCGAV